MKDEPLVGQHVGLVEARRLAERPSVGSRAAVLVDLVAPHPVGGVIDEAVPLRPAGGLVRRPLDPIAVQVLAHVRGHVSGPLEPDRQVLVGLQAQVAAATLRVEAEDAVVVGVLAGEEGRTRGAAERVGNVRAVERHPARAQQAAGAAHDRHVSHGLIVGHHEHHVGRRRAGRIAGLPRLLGRGRSGPGAGRQQDRRDQEPAQPTSTALACHRANLRKMAMAPR